MLDLNLPEIAFALQAVARASLLARQIQVEMTAPAMEKEDRSPVTVADFASQALIGYLGSLAFRHDPLVGEENSQALREPGAKTLLGQVTHYLERFIPDVSPQAACAWIDRGAAEVAGRYWTLDPIDGTKGFLRGGQYAVALALIEAGQVRLGVLGCPNLALSGIPSPHPAGTLFLAVRGEGAWQMGLPIGRKLSFSTDQISRVEVSPQLDPTQARLLRSFEASHTNVKKLDQLLCHLKVKPEPVRMDSQAKYALLAAGKGEALVKPLPAGNPGYREKIWDHAAGLLLVEEASGQVTDLDGKPLDLSTGRLLTQNRGVLASNGALHAVFLAAANAIGL